MTEKLFKSMHVPFQTYVRINDIQSRILTKTGKRPPLSDVLTALVDFYEEAQQPQEQTQVHQS